MTAPPLPRISPRAPAGEAARPFTVRPAAPGDEAELLAMFERCSPEVLYRRYHGAASTSVVREAARATTPTDRHRTWVAVDPGGAIRGTSTLARGHAGPDEVAFLVEDAWSHRGVGRALAQAVARHARDHDLPVVVASLHLDNQPAVRFLHAVWPGAQITHRGHGDAEAVMTAPPQMPEAV